MAGNSPLSAAMLVSSAATMMCAVSSFITRLCGSVKFSWSLSLGTPNSRL
jgi:hypothetical protein